LLLFKSLEWKYFIANSFELFEFTTSILLIPLIFLRIFDADVIGLVLLKYLIITKILFFFRWLNTLEKYRAIFATLLKLVPHFLGFLGILFVAFYFYITLGEYLFGGYIRQDLEINFQLYGDPNYYVHVNFNDFFMGFFTCFHLIIVNNWLFTVKVMKINNFLD